MKTVEVSTKADFEKAVKNNVERIIVTGDLAREIISAQKKKSVGKKIGIAGGIGIAVSAIAGIALAPFTAGASVAAAIPAVSHAVVTTTGGAVVAMTTAEVAIAASTILGVAGIAAATINTVAKNYNVKVNTKDTTVECTRKQ
ncbi:MAG: hypothetical protein J1E59_09725 [Treponema sp.]|nr:hypothetical protein [Treponema sp.]